MQFCRGTESHDKQVADMLTQRLAWSHVHGSLIAACISLFILSWIALKCLNVSRMDLVWWYTGVSTVVFLSIFQRIPFRGLFSGLQATSAFCCLLSAGGIVSPPQYVWSSGFSQRISQFYLHSAHPHVHPQWEWAIPAFAFPAITLYRMRTEITAVKKFSTL